MLLKCPLTQQRRHLSAQYWVGKDYHFRPVVVQSFLKWGPRMVEWIEVGVLGWCLHLCKAREYETLLEIVMGLKEKKESVLGLRSI